MLGGRRSETHTGRIAAERRNCGEPQNPGKGDETVRIYVSADMEGATGVVSALQTRSDHPAEYAFGCKMEFHDVMAVIEGAIEGGAKEILVNDSHARMINLDISGLPENVRLLSGTPKALGMVEGVEGYDGAFFTAYHAMSGTPLAVLDHTVSGATLYDVRLNGHLVGETGINGAVCAAFGVPCGARDRRRGRLSGGVGASGGEPRDVQRQGSARQRVGRLLSPVADEKSAARGGPGGDIADRLEKSSCPENQPAL